MIIKFCLSEPEMPEGSWKCEKCNNINYPFRTKCNRQNCGADKPSESEKSPSEPADETEQVCCVSCLLCMCICCFIYLLYFLTISVYSKNLKSLQLCSLCVMMNLLQPPIVSLKFVYLVIALVLCFQISCLVLLSVQFINSKFCNVPVSTRA